MVIHEVSFKNPYKKYIGIQGGRWGRDSKTINFCGKFSFILSFLFLEHLQCCYIYFHYSYIYNYYNYCQTLCIKACTQNLENLTLVRGFYLTRVSIFLIFFPWAHFHHLVVTQMKIGDQAFSQGIMQSDTRRGSYKDVLMIPKVFFILAQHWFKPHYQLIFRCVSLFTMLKFFLFFPNVALFWTL